LDEHTGAVGAALREALLRVKEKHPAGSGLTTAIDLAHRIMGLSAWASNEVTPVLHMSFGLMFLYSTAYENLAVDSPAIPHTLTRLQPYFDKDKVPNVISPFHMLFQMLQQSYVQPFRVHSN
jgi:hypothetical protein